MPLFQSTAPFLPTADADAIQHIQAEFEIASKEGKGTKDALVRLIWALVHSASVKDNARGVKLANNMETLETSDCDDLSYMIAVGEYKQGNLSAARGRVVELLKKAPENRQYSQLKNAIDNDMTNDTLALGAAGALAVVGGLAAVVAGALLSGRR